MSGATHLASDVEVVDVRLEVIDLGRKDVKRRQVEAARVHRG